MRETESCSDYVPDVFNFSLKFNSEYFFNCVGHIARKLCYIFSTRILYIDNRKRVARGNTDCAACISFLKLGVLKQESRSYFVKAVRLFPRPWTLLLFFLRIKFSRTLYNFYIFFRRYERHVKK